MTSKRLGVSGPFVVTIVALALVTTVIDVNAQAKRPKPAKDVTLTGRVVDFHCHMTGQMPSEDEATCTADCIRAGVPAGLDTPDGLIVLGQGARGPMKTLVPFAYQTVQVHGKLYEKNGVNYLDIASILPVDDETNAPADDDDNDEDHD